MGGWVYEMVYLYSRYRPREEVSGEAMDRWLEETQGERERALEEAMQPGLEERICHAYAVELLADYERHGLPYSGGSMEQPSFEMYVLGCVLTARERAEREIRSLEALQRKQESEQREREAEEKKASSGIMG